MYMYVYARMYMYVYARMYMYQTYLLCTVLCICFVLHSFLVTQYYYSYPVIILPYYLMLPPPPSYRRLYRRGLYRGLYRAKSTARSGRAYFPDLFPREANIPPAAPLHSVPFHALPAKRGYRPRLHSTPFRSTRSPQNAATARGSAT